MKLNKTMFLLILLFSVIFCNAQETNENPKEKIINAFKKSKEAKFFTEEIFTTKDKAKGHLKIVNKFISPNKYHSVWTTSEGIVLIEVIIIGNDEYVKDGDVWVKEKNDGKDEIYETLGNLFECSQEKYIKNEKVIGTEKLGLINATVIEYECNLKALLDDFANSVKNKITNDDKKDDIKIKFWIDENSLIVKSETVRTVEGIGSIEVTRKKTAYNYVDSFVIEAPKINESGKKIRKNKKNKNNER